MNAETQHVTERNIGGITYIIESVASESAKETAYDKIRKIILNYSSRLGFPKPTHEILKKSNRDF